MLKGFFFFFFSNSVFFYLGLGDTEETPLKKKGQWFLLLNKLFLIVLLIFNMTQIYFICFVILIYFLIQRLFNDEMKIYSQDKHSILSNEVDSIIFQLII